MDETRATARLPHLAVEIWHRRLPEDQGEQLAISLEATPSFAEFARFLERQTPWPWLMLQPWLAWSRIAQAAWQPWLAAFGGSTLPTHPVPAAERPAVPGAASDHDADPGEAAGAETRESRR